MFSFSILVLLIRLFWSSRLFLRKLDLFQIYFLFAFCSFVLPLDCQMLIYTSVKCKQDCLVPPISVIVVTLSCILGYLYIFHFRFYFLFHLLSDYIYCTSKCPIVLSYCIIPLHYVPLFFVSLASYISFSLHGSI